MHDDNDNPANLQMTKRMLQKHGWRFLLLEKIERSNPNACSKQMENKRASHFYNQRENYGEHTKSRKPVAKQPDKP
jgi:hypothetical protein